MHWRYRVSYVRLSWGGGLDGDPADVSHASYSWLTNTDGPAGTRTISRLYYIDPLGRNFQTELLEKALRNVTAGRGRCHWKGGKQERPNPEFGDDRADGAFSRWKNMLIFLL